MPVQAFVDDSGGKGQGKYFLMTGLVAHSEDWAVFSDEWRACLDDHPSVKYFKMREAASFSNQFHRFSETARNDKLLSLATIINDHAKIVTFSSIDLDAHAETWAVAMKKPLNEPYFWPFQNTILATAFELVDLGWKEPFEIVFDENVIFGPRAHQWYPAIRESMKISDHGAYSLMPVDPMFRSDMDFLPLQAADFVVSSNRRDGEDPNNRQFAWLDAVISKPYTTDYSQFYNRERMQAVLDESSRLRARLAKGELIDHLAVVEKYRELFER